jgi:hypothetical protein
MSGTRHTFHGADTASSKTFDRLADWATLRKELYADEVPAQLPHDTGAWKKSTGVGGYAPAGLAKDRSGAHDPCVATLESVRSPFPISRHTVKCTLRERCWSGEIFPTELLPMDNETVRFIGFTYFEQDGRALNHHEQESMMWRSAAMKFPCSRPASYQEYMDGRILGMPERNVSGCEIIFTGNPSRGDAPAKHKGWVLGGYPKRAVLKGDPLDGTTEIGSSFGRKAIVCVMPQRRLVRQPSLRTWGACRYDLWRAKSQPDMKAAQIQPEKASDDKTYVFGMSPKPSSSLPR